MVLDRFINGLVRVIRLFLGPFDDVFLALAALANEDRTTDDFKADLIDGAQPTDEAAEFTVDAVEEFIVDPLQDEGELTPENIERLVDEVEGNAAGLLLTIAGVGLATEIGTVGQVDTMSAEITQALAGLGIDDVTGAEIDARLQEGVAPALEAKVGKEHRAKFVNVQDAVEFLLRHKDGDEGWLQGENIPPEAYERIRSNDPVNPENAVEEWGIRDDQLEILEFVALEAMEFEELIETPAELGLVVDDEVLDLVLDLAGYPEPLKDFLRQVPKEIPRSNRLWEERTAVEPLVDELETLAADGEISPDEAAALIPAEAEDARDALRDRFANVQEPPAGAPTRSLVEDMTLKGYRDLDSLQADLDRLEYDTDAYEDAVRATVLDALDGDLQTAVAVGTLSEGAYSDLAEFAGVDDETIDLLLRGQSLNSITKQRLQGRIDPGELSVRTLSGIGDSRAAGLQAAGIETIGDMAEASVDTVETAASVSPETAEEFIRQATNRIS